MENIPDEARAYQQQYWAQVRAEEALKKQENKINPKKEAKFKAQLKKPCSYKQIETIARKVYGCTIEKGNGRHGVKIVTQSGERIPSVRHGGGKTVAFGTSQAIFARAAG